MSGLSKRYPDAAAFIATLDDFWGKRGHVRNRDSSSIVHGACPACRSKSTGRSPSERFSLCIMDGRRWRVVFWCKCTELDVLIALDRAEAVRHEAAADFHARRARQLEREAPAA